jgi:hypothetical protein
MRISSPQIHVTTQELNRHHFLPYDPTHHFAYYDTKRNFCFKKSEILRSVALDPAVSSGERAIWPQRKEWHQ